MFPGIANILYRVADVLHMHPPDPFAPLFVAPCFACFLKSSFPMVFPAAGGIDSATRRARTALCTPSALGGCLWGQVRPLAGLALAPESPGAMRTAAVFPSPLENAGRTSLYSPWKHDFIHTEDSFLGTWLLEPSQATLKP